MPEWRKGKAALLDRDGTIIHDHAYVANPDDVTLLPGAAEAIRRLATAGYASIVVTNQSGIARGLVSFTQYHAVRRRLDALLAAEGAALADTFTCPHHPEFGSPCGCRKPATEMYERAAAAHGLDLARCLYIGDRARDVRPAVAFGGRGVLVRSPITPDADLALAREAGIPLVPSLLEAVTLLLAPGS